MQKLPILRNLVNRTILIPAHQMFTSIPSYKWPGQDSHDKLLFTPGPLTTSWSVKNATLVDMGSRDAAFIKIISMFPNLMQCYHD